MQKESSTVARSMCSLRKDAKQVLSMYGWFNTAYLGHINFNCIIRGKVKLTSMKNEVGMK